MRPFPNSGPSEIGKGFDLVAPGFSLLDQLLRELCKLVVQQFDLYCQMGIRGILGIFLEEQIPLGLHLVANFHLIDYWFLHGRASLPIPIMRVLLARISRIRHSLVIQDEDASTSAQFLLIYGCHILVFPDRIGLPPTDQWSSI